MSPIGNAVVDDHIHDDAPGIVAAILDILPNGFPPRAVTIHPGAGAASIAPEMADGSGYC